MLRHFPNRHVSSWGLPDECLMRHAANFLEKNQAVPQFLTLFIITDHHPWNLPETHPSPLFSPNALGIYQKYLSTFHYSDACLGFFIRLLRENNLLQKTFLFILGNHGYPMGEHHNFIEKRYLYEENIRVTLLIGRILQPKKILSPRSRFDWGFLNERDGRANHFFPRSLCLQKFRMSQREV